MISCSWDHDHDYFLIFPLYVQRDHIDMVRCDTVWLCDSQWPCEVSWLALCSAPLTHACRARSQSGLMSGKCADIRDRCEWSPRIYLSSSLDTHPVILILAIIPSTVKFSSRNHSSFSSNDQKRLSGGILTLTLLPPPHFVLLVKKCILK